MKALKITGIVLVSLIVLLIVGMKATGISPIGFGFHDEIQSNNNIAIGGYDPVAYFTSNQPVQGITTISYSFKDAKWLFSSQENRNLFMSNPEKYMPVAGGHCILAASKGFVAPGNPETWDVKDGKLVLYNDQAIKNDCQENLSEIIKSSIKNW